MFLLRLTKALDDARINYAIVGGYAVALHGAIRGTLDVDIAIRISESAFVQVESALHNLGLESRIPVKAKELFASLGEFREKKRLVAWSFSNPKQPAEIVDIILTNDVEELKIVSKRIGDQTVNLVALEDLIAMKEKSNRPQDQEDVRALRSLQP